MSISRHAETRGILIAVAHVDARALGSHRIVGFASARRREFASLRTPLCGRPSRDVRRVKRASVQDCRSAPSLYENVKALISTGSSSFGRRARLARNNGVRPSEHRMCPNR